MNNNGLLYSREFRPKRSRSRRGLKVSRSCHCFVCSSPYAGDLMPSLSKKPLTVFGDTLWDFMKKTMMRFFWSFRAVMRFLPLVEMTPPVGRNDSPCWSKRHPPLVEMTPSVGRNDTLPALILQKAHKNPFLARSLYPKVHFRNPDYLSISTMMFFASPT